MSFFPIVYHLSHRIPAVPLELNVDLLKSAAVQFPVEDIAPLQLNIYSEDSRHFDIVSEVRRLPET